ncbi:hypothetical protein [Vallitalea guaymasensis]|uniref:hypothetical protein n=1 Tax=Vallitalea guaymasensis TaxID=1185412 RepID=UPI000DE1D8C1|nr:hypothetical protein [Vallitalea guaymasensis]
MKSKKIISIVLCMMLCITLKGAVFASNFDSRALSVGTNYKDGGIFGLGNVDTSIDAQRASGDYDAAGYHSFYITEPTYDFLRGQWGNKTDRMSSEILFFSGHANNQCVAFNYNNEGGDYKTGVYYKENFDSTSGYKYAGVQSYDLTNTKLITFAGCKTAYGNDNITKSAHDEGAEVTLGWTKKVAAGSHSNWLERYNDYLGKGYTVKESIDHADNYMYLDSAVKSHKLYGNEDLRLCESTETKALNLTENNRNYNIPYQSDNDIIKELKKINPDFNIDDYEVNKIKNQNNILVEYYYKVNGIKSISGYVVNIEENNIINISDNSIVLPIKLETKQNCSNLKSIENQLLTDNNLNIISKEKIFNYETGNVYMYYRIEHSLDGTETISVYEYLEEIYE